MSKPRKHSKNSTNTKISSLCSWITFASGTGFINATIPLAVKSSPWDRTMSTSWVLPLLQTLTRNVNQVDKRATHVAGGGLHSLALTEAGKVFTFGVNDDNALGRGVIDVEKLHLVEPITKGIRKEDYNQIVAIDSGDSHSLFLSIKGNVYQCGMYKDVDSGKFRDVPIGSSESPKGNNTYPTLVDLPGPVRDIEAGEAFNAAILEDGELYTWGMG